MNAVLQSVLLVLAVLLVAPLLGVFLIGLDRKVSARLQNRQGPPLLQPVYDVFKLFGKKESKVSRVQQVVVWLYLACQVLSLILLALGQDLIVILFVLALASVAFIIGGFSVKSPYSQLGSQREVMQLLFYEPLLIFQAVGFFLVSGTFLVSDIYELERPALWAMPAFFVTMVLVMLVKLRKSPFDTSASAHHAHQEVVRGPLTELSGPSLAVYELAHWYEIIVLLWFVGLLFATSWPVAILLALAALFAAIMVDNLTARMTWSWMLKFGWGVGVTLAVVNLAFIYYTRGS
jgi:ech hydrogenase subunit B